MKLSKVLSSVCAAIVALTCVSVPASAEGETYNCYIQMQNAAYSFRNEYDAASFGKDTEQFDNIIVWGNNDEFKFPEYSDCFDYDVNGYVMPADITDVSVTHDGVYSVKIENFDWALDGANSFNILTVNTDIPLTTGATIINAKIIIDGAVATEVAAPTQNPDEEVTVQAMFANSFNSAFGAYTEAYPASSLEIQFEITGLAAAPAPTGETPPTTGKAPASTGETPPTTGKAPADTGKTPVDTKGLPNTGATDIAGLCAIGLIASAALFIVCKKAK